MGDLGGVSHGISACSEISIAKVREGLSFGRGGWLSLVKQEELFE